MMGNFSIETVSSKRAKTNKKLQGNIRVSENHNHVNQHHHFLNSHKRHSHYNGHEELQRAKSDYIETHVHNHTHTHYHDHNHIQKQTSDHQHTAEYYIKER